MTTATEGADGRVLFVGSLAARTGQDKRLYLISDLREWRREHSDTRFTLHPYQPFDGDARTRLHALLARRGQHGDQPGWHGGTGEEHRGQCGGEAMTLQTFWPWAATIGGWLLALAGLSLLVWALFWDRAGAETLPEMLV